jgi:nucleoporin NUP2
MSANPSSGSTGSAPANTEEGGDDDAPLASGEPSVNLAASGGKGEENEDTVFEQRAKLSRLVDGAWKAEGLGVFRMKKAKENGKRRLLMRTDPGGNVILVSQGNRACREKR